LKRQGQFLKTTIIGGLVAIVPLAILGALVASMIPLVIEVASVLDEILPFSTTVNLLLALVGGVVLLVLICFLAGLALLTGPGDALRRRVDGVLERLVPFYGAARKLAERMTGTAGEDFVPVAIDLHGSGARSLGVLIENLSDGRCTVFVPIAPTAAFGNVYVVERHQIERINAGVSEVFGAISEWGVGSSRLFKAGSGESDG
jgi:uncharacterized membrane protein